MKHDAPPDSRPVPLPDRRGRLGLLISIRNRREAEIAMASGADFIDVKEPDRGPLGRPDAEVATEVADVVDPALPLSVALGEVVDLEARSLCPLWNLPNLRFAKAGPAGLAREKRWWRRWERSAREVPPHVGLVGVIYADWQAARAPAPPEALRVYAAAACPAILFDTYTKDGQSLFDLAPRKELSSWIQAARTQFPVLVLAGSLHGGLLHELREYGPDYVAFRGAACTSGRRGSVSGSHVRSLAKAIQQTDFLANRALMRQNRPSTRRNRSGTDFYGHGSS